MFESGDIIDPSDQFLQSKENIDTYSAYGGRRVDKWLAGSVIYAISTLMLVISLGPWGGRESVSPETSQPASHQTTQTALQTRPAERAPTDLSLAQSPQASHPNGRSAVQTAQAPIGQAPALTNAPLAKANNAAERIGVTSSQPSSIIESEQNVLSVNEPAQVRPTPEAVAETPGVSEERVSVTTATNIHTGPSISSDLIGVAHPGGEAVVVWRKSDWVQIVDPVADKTGWIHSSSLVPSSEGVASTEAALQSSEVPDEEVRSATVEPKPRAKAKNYRPKRHYGRRGIFRFALRRFR